MKSQVTTEQRNEWKRMVKALMHEQAMTLQEIAGALQVHPQTMQDWLRGYRKCHRPAEVTATLQDLRWPFDKPDRDYDYARMLGEYLALDRPSSKGWNNIDEQGTLSEVSE